MARDIEDLPNFQKERVKTLVQSRYNSDHVSSTFAGALLAKTPDGQYVLEITGAQDHGSVIDVKSASPYSDEAVEEAPVMDELDMRELAR